MVPQLVSQRDDLTSMMGVHVSKDGRDSTAILSLETGRLHTPDAPVNVFEEKLVHPVIGSIGFQQNLANVRIVR